MVAWQPMMGIGSDVESRGWGSPRKQLLHVQLPRSGGHLKSRQYKYYLTTVAYLEVSATLLRLYTSSQNTCQRVFFSVTVKYEPISIKIGGHVLKETLNKIVPKIPISPKICQRPTIMTGSYCLKNRLTYN